MASRQQRIRLQDLPNLTKTEGAQKAYTTWPAYRVSQGELRTFQWRLNDCFRQQRFPELVFASDASIALTMYLARNANGAAFDAPRSSADVSREHATQNSSALLAVGSAAAAAVVGCATAPSDAETCQGRGDDKRSFKERGQAKLDRLDQDETQKVCSDTPARRRRRTWPNASRRPNLATIKWPADGKYLGDWKNGEKIAQEGPRHAVPDDPGGPVGGNCYACHQLDAAGGLLRHDRPEPLPVRQDARLRRRDAEIRVRQDLQRRGLQRVHEHAALRPQRHPDEQQIKDVVALLLDPESPVNK